MPRNGFHSVAFVKASREEERAAARRFASRVWLEAANIATHQHFPTITADNIDDALAMQEREARENLRAAGVEGGS